GGPMRADSLRNALAVFALGLLALAAMTGGTNAGFTATTMNPSNVLGTATLSLTNDKPNAGDLVSVTNLVPGDTVSRTVTITNTGTVGFTYVAAAVPEINSVLWTDSGNGLQVTAKRGATVLYTGALKGLAIPASTTIAPSAIDSLTFDFSLPSSGDNTLQGITQKFTITYTATQLPGSAR
ncbi:MAG: M73 family metallopeptidase, partial [Chloroflexi bacterium]|nr:M73 family metallopeptidase [Chloroflexota bacterium]